MGAKELTTGAGWFPGRRVSVDQMIQELTGSDHDVVPPAADFLAEFSGLIIRSSDGSRSLRIDGLAAASHADPAWCRAYANAIGRRMTPVGEYSHMTLLIDGDGEFWAGFDAEYGFMGSSFFDVVNTLLVEPGSRLLDREIVDA